MKPSAHDLSDVIVLDTETTGFGPGTRIVEIAALHLRDGCVARSFHSLVHPEMRIPARVVMVHGITDTMVASAPKAGTVLAAFTQFAAGNVLVAHNAAFDHGVLVEEYRRTAVTPPKCPLYCSVSLARAMVPEAPRHGLGPLAAHLKLPVSVQHRALGDCETLAGVLAAIAARRASYADVRLPGRKLVL